jgi:hypothetical protein
MINQSVITVSVPPPTKANIPWENCRTTMTRFMETECLGDETYSHANNRTLS